MKHLLILLISILLLSSPVIGQETGVLYRWETSSEVYQWKTFGDFDFHTKYKGEIKNGKPNGFGIMYFINGNKTVGEWKNGKEWNTKHHKKDGTLIGRSVNGEWEKGWGVLFYDWRNGKWGWYEDGDEIKDDKYVGEIKNGVPNGKGTLTRGRHKYEGEYKDGEKHGQGTETLIGGGMYVGEYKNGLQDGNGIFYDKNGKITYRVVNGKMVKQ